MSEKEKYFERLAAAVIQGDKGGVLDITKQALAADIDAMELINRGIVAGTDKLGGLFQDFEIFLPELIAGGEVAKSAMDLLVAQIPVEEWSQSRPGTVVLGTVSGDLHDIGKNMVGAMLQASGFEVIDLGINVPVKDFIVKAEEVEAKIIALSSLMSTSLYYQKDVIDYLTDTCKRDKYFVIVGGGPVTPDWAKEIGADGCGKQANNAAEICKKLVSGTESPPLSEPLIIW